MCAGSTSQRIRVNVPDHNPETVEGEVAITDFTNVMENLEMVLLQVVILATSCCWMSSERSEAACPKRRMREKRSLLGGRDWHLVIRDDTQVLGSPEFGEVGHVGLHW